MDQTCQYYLKLSAEYGKIRLYVGRRRFDDVKGLPTQIVGTMTFRGQ
jgi:trehalose-6-phosphate synthase